MRENLIVVGPQGFGGNGRRVWLGAARFLVLRDEIGRYAPAVLNVIPVFPRPGADSHCVYCAGLAIAAAARTACCPGDLAGVLDVLPQRAVQLVTVLTAQ